MSPITTHVLDTARGRPARAIPVTLEIAEGPDRWTAMARGETDDDGRIRQFEPPLAPLEPAVYRLRFATDAYFAALRVDTFYPEVSVIFRIDEPTGQYHVPLLLSPFGYSTYRGS